MKITATFDSTAASAPAGYKTAVQSAIAFFETTFSDNITLNIDFTYKSLSGGIAQSETYYDSYDYSKVVAALKSDSTSTDDFVMLARLPKIDPISNPSAAASYNVSTAQAKALGLTVPGIAVSGLASNTTSDGTVTLGSGNTYTFDPNKRAVAGAIDAIGALEHEISEVMGRSLGSDGSYFKTVLGLSRYSSAGVLNSSSSYKNAYFSVDGQNMLLEMGEAGGDLGDWGSSVKGDACGYASSGTQLTFSETDIRSMDVIGYNRVNAAIPPAPAPTPAPIFTPAPVPASVTPPPPAPTPQLPFNALDYIASYADLIKAFGANATAGLSHWQSSGEKEGRRTTFNGLNYIASYGDLIKAFGADEQSGAAHFIQAGLNEKRSTSFKGLDYIASYGDLIKAFGADEQKGAAHFIQAGVNEKRSTTFNGLDYIASYGDLINAFGANEQKGATHFIQAGSNEKRSTTFNGLDYIASYGDLIKAFGADKQRGATHFIQAGANEKRATTFDGLAYIAQHSDLMKAFGANESAGAAHYITNGINEKRSQSFDLMAYKAAHSDFASKYTTNESFLTAYINTFVSTGKQLI